MVSFRAYLLVHNDLSIVDGMIINHRDSKTKNENLFPKASRLFPSEKAVNMPNCLSCFSLIMVKINVGQLPII